LRALLHDADANVAAKAAYALGLQKDLVAVSALSASVSSGPEVAREAAWALGEIGTPARNAITSAIGSTHDDGTTIQLLLAAAKLRPMPVAEVRPYLRAANASVVWAAAYAVARQRAPSGLRDLIALARSPIARQRGGSASRPNAPYTGSPNSAALIRAEIARALSKSATGDSLGAEAVGLLRSLASDGDAHVRINALR
jgi:HEAT repeat protein